MNKKGFTLVELIGSIVILGVIALLATAGYGSISKRVKEKNFENKVSYIENAAAKYASETGYLTTNVQELMEKGYITADKNSGDILNPVNDSKMNCHVVTIEEENNNFYANYTETEECDLSNLDIVNINLRIDKYDESGKKLEVEEWTRSNVTLEVNFKDSNIDISKVSRITWISNGGREEEAVSNDFESKKKKTVSASQIMNTGYSVEVLLNDGVIYQARTTVRIDKQRPVVYKDELEIEKENIYVNHDRKVKVTASDLNGSGVYGYYIGVSKDCRSVNYERGTEAFEKTLDNGEYYVCVKDNVGNISEDESNSKIEINRVDKIAPRCEWSGENNVWTNNAQGVTITLKGVDNESGSDSVYTETYTSGTVKSKTLSYTIKDEAGNETKCEKEVNVYVDYEAPSCNWSGESDVWTSGNRTISVAGSDNGSGVNASTNKTWTYSSGETKTDYLSQVIKDNVGNQTTCEGTKNIYVDKVGPSCNWSGESNAWTNGNRTISVAGSDNGSGVNASTNKTWTYDSGETKTAYLSQTIKDNVGNQTTCSGTKNIYVDKVAPTCSISVSGTSGSSGWYTSNLSFSLNTSDGNNTNRSGVNTNRNYITSTSLNSDTISYSVSGSVYDNAGNSGSCSTTIKKDGTAPSCNWSGESNVWTSASRSITVYGSDSTSGPNTSTNKTWTYNSGETKTAYLSQAIKDNAGNQTTCSRTANVYVDKTGPTKPTSGSIGAVSGSNTTGTIQNQAGGSSDGGSGGLTYKYLIKNDSSTPSKSDSRFSTNRNFTRSCGTSYYAWVIAEDSLGNRSEPFYLGSTSDGANSYSGWSSCSKECGGGTQTRTNSCALITSNLSQSCNTQTCSKCNYHFSGFTHSYDEQRYPDSARTHYIATNIDVTYCKTISFKVKANISDTNKLWSQGKDAGPWCTADGYCMLHYRLYIGNSNDINLFRIIRLGDNRIYYEGLLESGDLETLAGDRKAHVSWRNNEYVQITQDISNITGVVNLYTEFEKTNRNGNGAGWWAGDVGNNFEFTEITLSD